MVVIAEYSALYLAARNGDFETLQYIVEAGAYLDVVTSWGMCSKWC